MQGLLVHESGCNLGLVLHGAEEEGGDALHSEDGGQLRLLVDIDFIDIDLSGIFGSYLLEYGGQLAAGSAPCGVEVDNAGAGAQELPAVGGLLEVGHLGEELGLGQVAGFYGLYFCALFGLGRLLLGLAGKEKGQAGEGYSQQVFYVHNEYRVACLTSGGGAAAPGQAVGQVGKSRAPPS